MVYLLKIGYDSRKVYPESKFPRCILENREWKAEEPTLAIDALNERLASSPIYKSAGYGLFLVSKTDGEEKVMSSAIIKNSAIVDFEVYKK